jgi:hypothetical protein
MDVNLELYEEGPVEWARERVHVTLSKDYQLFLNRWALAALGEPEGVAVLFDKRLQVIGVMPAALGRRHVFPLRRRTRSEKGRVITVKGFCRKFGIRPSETIAFTTAKVNRDGVMLLDLNQVAAVGRVRSE